MRDVLYIDDIERATVLLKSPRIDVLQQMTAPITCSELGSRLGQTPQAVYYHVKALEKADLVEKVAERRVRAINEGIYQAKARSYWLSPRLVGKLGGERRTRDQMSLGHLISLAERVQEDVGRLAEHTAGDENVPSLGISAQVELADASRRAEFMRDVQDLFEELARKYGATGSRRAGAETYSIALACYPSRPSA